VIRRLGGRGTLPLFALLKPITLAIHLQDMDMMRESVEQRAGEPLRGKDAGPFVKRQVAGHQGRAAFVALTRLPLIMMDPLAATSNGRLG
jgi:hypothetical protein